MALPLEGVRVIELNRVAPGSYCTMMLGDMGADVIRIETPASAAGDKHNLAKEEDIWQIKAWTDAWVQRLGMMQTEEEAIWSTEMEIEAQHYFQPIFDRLREEPDDSLLSDLVNTEIPEWGRTLTDNELHAEMMADTFVGGSETSTNAISAGVMLLIRQPDQWDRLKSDPERYLPVLVEEILRYTSPSSNMFRRTTRDVEVAGVTIPENSICFARFAAANQDDERFPDALKFDITRDNLKDHVAFGKGVHHCLGAAAARLQGRVAFEQLLSRFPDFSVDAQAGRFAASP